MSVLRLRFGNRYIEFTLLVNLTQWNRLMGQLNLFPSLNQQFSQPQPPPSNTEAIDKIRGFRYIPNYITEFQHDWLLDKINKQQWHSFAKRRVQHYGPKYNYKTGKLNHDTRMSDLPEWLNRLSHKLHKDEYTPEVPNQVLVSEYQPGQGIGGHIDREPWFKDTIIALSLGSSCIMEFTNQHDKTKKVPVWLAPRSVAVLREAARYTWLHGIPARKSDMWDGCKYARQRRISLTFRTVIV